VEKYRVLIKRSAAKELEIIGGRKDRKQIADRISVLADDPRPPGVEKLSGTTEKYRIRQANYRIVYEIQDEVLVVYVVRVADRKDVHRKGSTA
jgi:mRNA interferase RelE/StbE